MDYRDTEILVYGQPFRLRDAVGGGRLFHGSPSKLDPGDVLRPQTHRRFRESPKDAVSVTTSIEAAAHWASEGGFVYQVEPLGPVEQWKVAPAEGGASFDLLEGRVPAARIVRRVHRVGPEGVETPRGLTNDALLEILERAKLEGMGGRCGDVAIAINRVLFDFEGELVAAANRHLWDRGQFAGHVAVRVGDDVWDAQGVWEDEPVPEDLLSWGMLDPEDPDYGLPTDAAAEDVIFLEDLSEDDVRAMLPFQCPDVYPILVRARDEVLGSA